MGQNRGEMANKRKNPEGPAGAGKPPVRPRPPKPSAQAPARKPPVEISARKALLVLLVPAFILSLPGKAWRGELSPQEREAASRLSNFVLLLALGGVIGVLAFHPMFSPQSGDKLREVFGMEPVVDPDATPAPHGIDFSKTDAPYASLIPAQAMRDGGHPLRPGQMPPAGYLRPGELPPGLPAGAVPAGPLPEGARVVPGATPVVLGRVPGR
jgi:hypothetical protein